MLNSSLLSGLNSEYINLTCIKTSTDYRNAGLQAGDPFDAAKNAAEASLLF